MGSEFDLSKYMLTFDFGAQQKNEPEKDLDEFLEENKIKVDENGNFEMYLVVDLDEEECEPGAIVYKKMIVLSASGQSDYLRESGMHVNSISISLNLNPYTVHKQKSIRDDLLKIEDKVLKVLVNKDNVVEVRANGVTVVKYQIIEELKLNPALKFKVVSVNQENGFANVFVYNSITNKGKNININVCDWCFEDVNTRLQDIKHRINDYLNINQRNTDLINSLAENGEEL